MDCGEGVDLADLRLGGKQEQLVREIHALGKPVITVLIQGRPLAIAEVAELSDALLCAWYPGSEGGRAIGEILFGQVNPSGKLSVSIPHAPWVNCRFIIIRRTPDSLVPMSICRPSRYIRSDSVLVTACLNTELQRFLTRK